MSVDSDVLIQMPARRILMNQHFQLNCSITYYQSQNLTVELHWMVPQLRGIDVRNDLDHIVFIRYSVMIGFFRADECDRRK